MATHRALVAFQKPCGGLVRMDSEIDYAGAPNWKFEPLDEAERAIWADTVAQPHRVDRERSIQWGLTCLRPVEAEAQLDGWGRR